MTTPPKNSRTKKSATTATAPAPEIKAPETATSALTLDQARVALIEAGNKAAASQAAFDALGEDAGDDDRHDALVTLAEAENAARDVQKLVAQLEASSTAPAAPAQADKPEGVSSPRADVVGTTEPAPDTTPSEGQGGSNSAAPATAEDVDDDLPFEEQLELMQAYFASQLAGLRQSTANLVAAGETTAALDALRQMFDQGKATITETNKFLDQLGQDIAELLVAMPGEAVIEVTSSVDGRRRAGREFSSTPTRIPVRDLSEGDLELLRSDPVLTIKAA